MADLPPCGCSTTHRLRRQLVRERTARLEAESIAERFTRAALHDPLTGLANRAQVLDRLEVALNRCGQGPQVAVLFLDLDDFKQVNDRHGHLAGDELLCEVASRLLRAARPTDLVARLGGDEFVVVCDWTSTLEDAQVVADRVQLALARPHEVPGLGSGLRASIGLRLATTGETAEGVLRDADAAMYVAKTSGKARSAHHDQIVKRHSGRRGVLEAELERAIAGDQIEMWYQQIVRLADEFVVGAEALARWHHPTRGLVPPDEFIPGAERSGLVVELDRLALRTACRQAAEWGFDRHGRTMSVNAAIETLQDAGYVRQVARTLRSCGLNPRSLTIEITEHSLAGDNPVLRENLANLRALGVGLAIDDFGQEYSSFAYLRRLPVDAVKIDRSFVADVGVAPRDEALVAAISGVAKAFGMRAVAEGVETAGQADTLRALGVEEAQGWHFARPVPAELWPHSLLPAGSRRAARGVAPLRAAQ